MDKLIKENKNKFTFFIICSLFIGMTSCGILKSKKDFNLLFSSGYDNDKCTIVINGKTYYKNEPIITDGSLGIDLNKNLSFKEEVLKINVLFDALIDEKLNISRKVELDTTLYLKDGYNVIIFASSDQVKIKQQSKIYELE